MDQRLSYVDGQCEETKRYFVMVAEGLPRDIRQVAEGFQFFMHGQSRIMDCVEKVREELGTVIKFRMPIL